MVLSHVGHENTVVARGFGYLSGDLSHIHQWFPGVYLRFYDLFFFHLFTHRERFYPFGVFGGSDFFIQLLQYGTGIAQYRYIALHVFVEFRRVDVYMNYFGLSGILFQVARYSVVEPHADGDEQVAFVGLNVGGYAAVHA